MNKLGSGMKPVRLNDKLSSPLFNDKTTTVVNR